MRHWYEGDRMIREALDYFKGHNAYRHLFLLFKNKYQSLGRIGGNVKVDVFTEDELITIGLFFGKSSSELKKKGKISLEEFEKQLDQTKFAGLSLKELLEAYFNEPLVSKKEAKRIKDRQMEIFMNQLVEKFPSLSFWFDYLRNKTADTHWVYRLMEEVHFGDMANYLDQAFRQLPTTTYERLPLFSQRITRNPHAFDLNTNLGRLFIHVLSVHSYKGEQVVVPSTSEGMNDLLLAYHLLRDDITNFVTAVNLLAETEHGFHPMWKAATTTYCVMNIPLRELIGISRVYPAGDQKSVWIVENSGVYSSILDELPAVPLVCTHGQFKLAGLILLDLLVAEDCQLYYAGDIDPEGLGMAARLLQRYPNHVHFWKMDRQAYQKSVADIELSNERLKKLESITVEEFIPVIEEMKRKKRAGYQEALVSEMINELKMQYL